MHLSAMNYGSIFFSTYCSGDFSGKTIVDVGAQDVNGSLRDFCPVGANYIGVDFAVGRGVDVVMADPYHLPFDTGSVDVVVCSSVFEHSEFFWLLFLECVRVLKPQGLIYLNMPSNGMVHRYPIDGWRFYPDAGKALVNWARYNDYSPLLLESFLGERQGAIPGEGMWNDFVAVILKNEIFSLDYPERIQNLAGSFHCGYCLGRDVDAPTDEFLPDYSLILEQMRGIEELNKSITEVNEENISLKRSMSNIDEENISLKRSMSNIDGENISLRQSISEIDGENIGLKVSISELDRYIKILSDEVDNYRTSNSWYITAPLRFFSEKRIKLFSLFSVMPQLLKENSGLVATIVKTLRVLFFEGPDGVRQRIRLFFARKTVELVHSVKEKNLISIVPYYIDPRLDSGEPVVVVVGPRIAIHLHLYYVDMLDVFSGYLNNIPLEYDIFVSVSSCEDVGLIELKLKKLLIRVGNIVVENVPNRGRDIAPMIVQFGSRLSGYELIAHLHTKKTPHQRGLQSWGEGILHNLMGPPNSSGGRIARIIELLQTGSKIVYPEGQCHYVKGRSGWADNYNLAKFVLEKYTSQKIEDFECVEFPEGAMFWARSECLGEFLELPLSYSDFPEEPIPSDGTLAHALERLIFVFASSHEGRCIRLHSGDSITDYREYEEQKDFSNHIVGSDIKILSYYLPQFHPIPENDIWHGDGFTEWTKVRASNPLFEGHYQQHIPHPDISYYLLDSPDTLRLQAEQMAKAGVHGQIFYHYWFAGRMILEEPAKLLLETADINMPFSFCWANENWTRRWDGNENEILLGQSYSEKDAREFIRYLIPFFKDSRYIRIDDRPMLSIYRPSSIPNPGEYLDIWEFECLAAGIKKPYVVAVLTRGASDPRDFGMDAAVERVLHDWTSGGAPEIKGSLNKYWPVNGSVLSYDDVSAFYMGQGESKDFTYFRSLVPMWDNTPRYGSEAFLLHGSSPERFQEWLENLISYTRLSLPSDRRFLVVNAWNEWAEGAHLEPDSRYGYAYLNSVGRSLSGVPYAHGFESSGCNPENITLHISIPGYILSQLNLDPVVRQRFFNCLSNSSVFEKYTITVGTQEVIKELPSGVKIGFGDADFVLEFRKIAYFDFSAIEKMVQHSCKFDAAVVANSYDESASLVGLSSNGSIEMYDAYEEPMLVTPRSAFEFGYKNIRVCADARCFVTGLVVLDANEAFPVVTTIIRYHKDGALSELKNALYCLYAMKGCTVVPYIAAQDLSSDQVVALKGVLGEFCWAHNAEPRVDFYNSGQGAGDLRSVMLNESIKKVNTRYAAFLDYDDLLMPHAYSWLLGCLRDSGRSVSFGRVYAANVHSATGVIFERNCTYQYGFTYADFLLNNHAPLHSFMLDLSLLDLSNVVYFEDQRYMEDYLLTLQLFTDDGCDWGSLMHNKYIGDYNHSVDRDHTLAFSDERERQALLDSAEYKKCWRRIVDMRMRMQIKNSLQSKK